MPTVYLVQRPIRDIDLSSAEEYGKIEFVFEDSHFQPSQRPGVAQRLTEKFAEKFNPDEDYIVAKTGDPNGSIFVGMTLSRYFPGKEITLLRWERIPGGLGQGFYTPTKIRT